MKKYKKKAIKEKDQVSETEEVPDGKVQQTLLPDYIGTESEGGDYVNHAAEEVDPVRAKPLPLWPFGGGGDAA